MTDAAQKYREHIGACATCSATPHALCDLGKQLLEACAIEAAPAQPEPEDFEVTIGPEDRKTFAAALKSVLGSRTRAVGAVDGAILRALLDTLCGHRESR